MSTIIVQIVDQGADPDASSDIIVFFGKTHKIPEGHVALQSEAAASLSVTVSAAVTVRNYIKCDWKYLGCAASLSIGGVPVNFRAFSDEQPLESVAELSWGETPEKAELFVTVCAQGSAALSEVLFSSLPKARWQSCTATHCGAKTVTISLESSAGDICRIC